MAPQESRSAGFQPARSWGEAAAAPQESRSAGFQPARSNFSQRRPLHANLGRTAYFVSTRTRASKHIFIDDIAQLAVTELRALRQQYGFLILAYVFMSDHAHFVLVPTEDFTISQTVRLIKGSIARRVNEYLQQQGPLWQEGFWDEAPRTIEQVNAYIEYIHANPVKAELSGRPEDYAFSSANGSCMEDYHAFFFENERES